MTNAAKTARHVTSLPSETIAVLVGAGYVSESIRDAIERLCPAAFEVPRPADAQLPEWVIALERVLFSGKEANAKRLLAKARAIQSGMVAQSATAPAQPEQEVAYAEVP
jgi:hypothetical protein